MTGQRLRLRRLTQQLSSLVAIFAKLAIVAGSALIFAGPAWAEKPRVLVVHEDSGVSHEAMDYLQFELTRAGWPTDALIPVEMDQDLEKVTGQGSESVIVALGMRAYAKAVQEGLAEQPLVGAMIAKTAWSNSPLEKQDSRRNSNRRSVVILLDQAPARWANLIHLAFPHVRRVGILSANDDRQAEWMESSLSKRGYSLVVERISRAENVISGLEHLLSGVDLLLALPDALTHNRYTVQPVLLTTYRAHVPVLAYSSAYQQAGAVMALYSTVPQIMTQVVECIESLQSRETVPSIQSPKYFTVGINAAVAQSLGMNFSGANDLRMRMLTMDE